jgi:competence protein ComEA
MFKKIFKNTKMLIIVLGLFFAVIIVILNCFYHFVPETVKTETLSISQSADSKSATEVININKATASELELLSGIGETKASAIVNYRTKHGAFKKKKDIINVYGIGEKTYEKIKDKISVK